MLQSPPIVREHEGIAVVRDDLFPGGTKARFLPALFEDCDELVYASPCEGGAQTAIAQVAQQLGKRATIFCAKRKDPHPRSLMAKRLGAQVMQVSPGYLSVVQKRADQYVRANQRADVKVRLLDFGIDLPGIRDTIAAAARSCALAPREVWCAAGSGVLASGLQLAWPKAKIVRVRVGRELPTDTQMATLGSLWPFEARCKLEPPFPSDPHYDAKAWQLLTLARSEDAKRQPQLGLGEGIVFWNVTGPAEP